jgi:hypothetical protein
VGQVRREEKVSTPADWAAYRWDKMVEENRALPLLLSVSLYIYIYVFLSLSVSLTLAFSLSYIIPPASPPVPFS